MPQQTIEGFRLSHQQQRVWLLQQMDRSVVYRAQCAVLLEGKLEREKLTAALHEVVRRHEILRTSFRSLPSMVLPLQVVDPKGAPSIEWQDLTNLEATVPSPEKHSLIRTLPAYEQNGPPRFDIVMFSAREHILIVTLSALCADEVTLKNLVSEISACYHGKPEPAVDEPTQYVDYAEWQHELFESEDTEEERNYWRHTNPSRSLDVKLPLENAVGHVHIFAPATRSTTVGPETLSKIDAFITAHDLTYRDFLFACWQTLLWRLTHQAEIVIAGACDCRSYESLQQGLGLFTSYIPLRFKLEENNSFEQVSMRSRETLRAAEAAQDYFSWDQMAAPEQNGSGPNFAAITFDYISVPPAWPGPDVSFKIMDQRACLDRFKLRLSCRLSEDQLITEIHYDPAILTADCVGRLSGQFHKLLESILDAPQAGIASLDLLGDDECRRLLCEFNQTASDYAVSRCMHQLFAEQAERTPANVALVFEEQVLTYHELNSRSNQLAHLLRKYGVGPEVRVGLYTQRSVETLIGLLGILKAGGAYVPLDRAVPPARLTRMLADAEVKVLLTHEALSQGSAEFTGQIIYLDSDWTTIARESTHNPDCGVVPENLACVIYTSGSTGIPKGVGVEHRQLSNYLHAISERLALPPGSSFATVSTIAADLGNTAIFPALCLGGSLHLISEERALDPEGLGDYFSRWQIDCLKIVPSHLMALMASNNPERVLPRRRLVLGGEASSWMLIEKIKHSFPEEQVLNHYGPTEATVGVLTYELGDELPSQAATVPLGRPIANTQIYILDSQLQPVPIGVAGELYIGGKNVTRGYLNAPDITAERFVPHHFSVEPGARLYRTGDLARYLPDGNVEFLARVDHQVKINGFRIELGEIESALSDHPSVAARTVVVREDTPGEKRLVAYVVAGKSQVVTQDELRAFLEKKIPAHMIPPVIVMLDSLPLRPNGKLDQGALPLPEKVNAEAKKIFVAPHTATEKALVEVWAEVLGLERVGIHDNFFRLGGDSIRGIRVLGLSQDRDLHFSMQQLFQHQTIYELARVLSETAPEKTILPSTEPFSLISLEDRIKLPLDVEDAYPLAKLQEGMLFHSEFAPGSSMYHDITSVHLKCGWNFQHMLAAMEKATAKHAVLRTGFDLASFSEPLQLVYKSIPTPLEVEDIRHLSPVQQEQAIDEWLEANSKHRFRWNDAPQLRYQIHRRDDDSFQFTLSRHHSIIDGWSSSSLFTELFQHYLSLLAGIELPPEPPLMLTYRDFVALEREALSSVADREFWSNKLSDSTITLEPDGTEPAQMQEYPVSLSPEVSEGLQRLAQTAGLPLKDVLLAAHVRVMSLVSGQSDIVTGLVMHGRPDHVDGERVLGLFLNTLPLRLKLKGGTWMDLAQDAFEAELEMMPHRRYPLAAIQSDLGRQRLFDTGMIFVNFHVYQSLEPAKNEIEPLGIKDIQETNFKFMAEFSLSPFNSQVELNLRVDKNVFTESQIASFVQYYSSTLSRMSRDPLERYDSVCLLTDHEQQQILRDWNDTRAEYPAEQCVHQLIEEQAARQPNAVALICRGERLTYREFNERANQLAHYLKSLGVGAESLVGVCLERGVEMMVALLGILKAGGAYLPLDPEYPAERLRYMIEDAGVRVVLTREELTKIGTQPRENPRIEVRPENLAYVIYTSGSTGLPKGIMVNHENVVNFFTGIKRSIGDEPAGTWLAVTSISFDISVLELLGTLARGFEVVIHSDPGGSFNSISPRRRFSDQKMDFSLFYFASDESEATADKYQLLIEGAKFADRNGFDAVWTPERHFHAFGGLYPNPAITSAVVAAITEHVKIRAGSVVLPLHNPIRVAEEWSVVDNVSKGRVGLSFASGWHANDFVLAPGNFQQRKEIMMRGIETVRGLWRGDAVALPGPFGNELDVKILPHPIQRELPVWLTAAGNPETFQAAGEAGANLLTHLLGQSIEELSEKIAVYRESWRKAGHGPGEGYVTLMLHTFVGEDLEEVREKVRKPFTNYLKSSVGLVQQMKQGMGYDPSAELTEADLEVVAASAFKRYFGTSGLLGTPETCLEMVDRLKEIGVDEIGCLIDFGVDFDSVMSSLKYLNLVRQRSNEQGIADYSLPAQITRHGVTHLQCTPSMAKMLTLEPDARDSMGALKKLMLGGEELPSALVKDLKEFVTGEMHNMYGPTETTIWSATYQIKNGDNKIPIGRPLANTEIYILDQFLQPVPAGTPGDLFIGGVGVVRGYLNRPDLTADRFMPDPFSSRRGARLYATGDRARYLSDGDIEFLGRMDQQVKIRGFRIEPEEIENVVRSHPAVRDAVVVAREFVPGEKQLVAYLVPAEQGTPDIDIGEWRSYLKEKVPEYMLPASFVMLDALPLTPNGKIDRRALLELPATLPSQFKENYVAPRTAAEGVVAGMWEQTLGIEQVGVLDNFFELGGNSLSAMRIMVRLREIFQVDLPLRGLFEAPTVEGVVELTAQVWGARDIVEQIAETVKEVENLSAGEAERLLFEANSPSLVESA